MDAKSLSPFLGLAGQLAKSAGSAIEGHLDAWSNKTKLKKLYNHIDHYRYVKTIWQADTAVDLFSFYYPSKIRAGGKITAVNRLSDLPSDSYIIIQGIAGQGKSIFLRYLCVTELGYGDYIPVLIELRNIQSGERLMDHIVKSFTDYGLEFNDIIFDAYCKSNKLLLLLDAFDEADEAVVKPLIQDLETLARRFPNLRTIVTTRPDSDLRSSAAFRVIDLAPLRYSEYERLIEKLVDDTKLRASLIKAINEGGDHVKPLLTTPLLVTLLVITYKYSQVIPASLSEFYDLLFQLLLLRHDGAKPGFHRARKCKLSDVDYRRAFEALSFYSKRSTSKKLTFIELAGHARDGLSKIKLVADAADLLSDICRITCLLVRDGDEIRFIHRTVQEYYAASFITRFPEERAKAFYEKAIEKSVVHIKWRGEFRFLKEIDEYKYSKYATIPNAVAVFAIPASSIGENGVLEKIEATLWDRLRKVEVEFLSDSHWSFFDWSQAQLGLFSSACFYLVHRCFDGASIENYKETLSRLSGKSAAVKSESTGGETSTGVPIRDSVGFELLRCNIEELNNQHMKTQLRVVAHWVLNDIRNAVTIVEKHEAQDLKGFFDDSTS